MFGMTNATKANIIGAINAVLGVAVLFGLPLSSDQLAGIVAAVNAVLVLIVGLTYKDSDKRLPDGVSADEISAANPGA